uniref:Uncharacterized protein n=1 Tax=Nelumbo nucifera TaxID=4432 RepID=A0A822XIN4_NELNU|nr:TPA_asm: hypothetical protein HUJ06_021026 [Nelumbo nucifera]
MSRPICATYSLGPNLVHSSLGSSVQMHQILFDLILGPICIIGSVNDPDMIRIHLFASLSVSPCGPNSQYWMAEGGTKHVLQLWPLDEGTGSLVHAAAQQQRTAFLLVRFARVACSKSKDCISRRSPLPHN